MLTIQIDTTIIEFFEERSNETKLGLLKHKYSPNICISI